MKTVSKLALLALGTVLAGAAVAEPLEISGSTTIQKRVLEPGADGLKAATGIDLKVIGNGTGKGLIYLIEGKTKASGASETLDEAILSAKKAAKESDKQINVPGNLQFHEVTKDSVVVILNKDNPVSSVTKEQLKDINIGKIKNWKEIGGPDLPIKVVTSHAGSATRAVFQKQIMDGADYVGGVTEVRTTREEINEVSKDKGGIGAVSEGFFAQNPGKAKTVKAPSMVRPLGLITVGAPAPEVQKVIDFFKSPAGKKLIQ